MALLLQIKLLVLAKDTAGAAPLFERLLAMPGFAAQAHYWKGTSHRFPEQRFPEAAAEYARAIALEPLFAVAQGRRLDVLSTLADREELRRALAALPAQLKTDSRLAGELFMVHWSLRDGDQAARALENLPQEYIEAGFIKGPKAMYLGLAHRVAGRREAAVVEWQGALRTVDKRLASGKTEPGDVLDRAWLLAVLGREAEALDSLRLFEQLIRRPVGRPTTITVYLYAELGQEELVWAFFDRIFSAKDAGPAMASAYLLTDCFDRYRELPRFREINRRAEELVANARLPAGTAKTVPPPAAAGAPQAAEKSVAVLAFKNLSGDPAREFFSDGLSEAVTDVLGRVPGLKVVGSASAFSFKGKSVPIPEIARQLGVTHLVDGTVIQDGQTVRITAKLIQADGFQVWVSDKLDRELKNIFALHDEVAGLIAKNLSLKLGASSAASKAPVNPEAFELYVQARQAWNLRNDEGFARAEQLLNRALEIAPNFARAHTALADVWLTRGQLTGSVGASSSGSQPELARIVAKISRALELDPSSAEAYASLGNAHWLSWNSSEAERELRRAIELNPNYASAHQWLGRMLQATGRIDEGMSELKLAAEVDPLSPIVLSNYGAALSLAGRYSAAIEVIDRALRVQPNSAQALYWKAYSQLKLGWSGEAVAAARQWPVVSLVSRTYRVRLLGLAGLHEEAGKIFSSSELQAAVHRSYLLLALGRTDEALAALDPGTFAGAFAGNLFLEPLYDPIRSDPRFVSFLAALGLTEAHARAQAWRKANPPDKPAAKP
jgi:adenylate cyclase